MLYIVMQELLYEILQVLIGWKLRICVAVVSWLKIYDFRIGFF